MWKGELELKPARIQSPSPTFILDTSTISTKHVENF